MSKSIVRCRCGHQVLGREVLRTQPCEKPSGAEAFYVKFRCRRCKKIGEAFVPAEEWTPDIFDVPRGEIGAFERDRFVGTEAIASGDVISFHCALQKANTVSELLQPSINAPASAEANDNASAEVTADAPATESRRRDKRAGKDAAREGDKPQNDKPSSRSRGGN